MHQITEITVLKLCLLSKKINKTKTKIFESFIVQMISTSKTQTQSYSQTNLNTNHHSLLKLIFHYSQNLHVEKLFFTIFSCISEFIWATKREVTKNKHKKQRKYSCNLEKQSSLGFRRSWSEISRWSYTYNDINMYTYVREERVSVSNRFFHVPVEMCGDLFGERENLRRSERFRGGGESVGRSVWRVVNRRESAEKVIGREENEIYESEREKEREETKRERVWKVKYKGETGTLFLSLFGCGKNKGFGKL